MSRFILHADMDAFYASVEQRDDPSLRGKPVIIGAESARGVVSAASYEARKYGVRSAMPGFKARELCPNGIFLPGNMKKYARVSGQIHKIFADFTDVIEPLALDEAFLDIGGSVGLLGEPRVIGQKIKDRVREDLGLTISVGIAPNKLVAKIACSLGKPNGLKVVAESEVRAVLNPLPVRALWGVGPKAELRLKEVGILTIGALAEAPLSDLQKAFGAHARDMQERARGIDDRPVENAREAQSIGEEATFSDNVVAVETILSAIVSHSERVAARARKAKVRGRTVTLKVKLAKRKVWGAQVVGNHDLFPIVSRQARLPSPSSDASEIGALARSLWEKLALTEAIRLLGVTLSDLEKEQAPRQLGLFDVAPTTSALPQGQNAVASPGNSGKLASGASPTARRRTEALGYAMDAISEKFGDGIIGRAAGRVEKITASDKIKVGETDLSDEDEPSS